MVKKALILSFASLVLTNSAQADLSASTCEELSQAILRKSANIESTIAANAGRLTREQSLEVDELLSLACSPQFSECGFSACNAQNTPPTSNSSSDEGPNGQPLAWVTENMSCEAFLGELRSRFKPDGLDENKRRELKAAHELACGVRFKHCNFEACRKTATLD